MDENSARTGFLSLGQSVDYVAVKSDEVGEPDQVNQVGPLLLAEGRSSYSVYELPANHELHVCVHQLHKNQDTDVVHYKHVYHEQYQLQSVKYQHEVFKPDAAIRRNEKPVYTNYDVANC